MKLKMIKMVATQTERGAFCDRESGPKVLQMTVQDEETGNKYYCAYLEIGPLADFTVTKRDMLHAIANDYLEDVIPWRLERYATLLLKLTPGRAEAAPAQKAGALPEGVYAPSVVDYSLSEPNVLVLDMAEYKLSGDAAFSPKEEMLRLDILQCQRQVLRWVRRSLRL